MARLNRFPKEESFNFRIDSQLKADFQTAAEGEDRPAAQVLRDFMRAYVERRRHRTFAVEARRQSALLAGRAADTFSGEADITRWIEGVSDTAGWTA